MSRLRLLLFLILAAVLLSTTPVLAAPGDGTTVWVDFNSQTELALLARRLDIWEVHRAGETGGGRLLAWATPAEMAWMASEGLAYEFVPSSNAGLATIPDYACYRTVDELTAQLTDWAAAYPGLTELRSIGRSYEDRPLYVLRMTNEATVVDKPVLFLMAGIHGRELIAPEAAMAFIERLLSGYGLDPEITWILDTQVIEVMVTANPDGHVRNEAGTPWSYWRKNANPENGICGGTDFGVDLNRNSRYAWGGASTDPCSLLYQGPSSVSETETQAVEGFIRTLFADQRPDDLTSPSPETTAGLFISLHSYGDLVLWPWGHTYTEAPNADALSQLGRKLARFNGYTAQQASDLYPASGTTDDFVYGELGIAAYTFEIGNGADGFYPPCSRYDALVSPNVEAFLYAAKVARAPYLLPAGPEVIDLAMTMVTSTPVSANAVTSQALSGTAPALRIVAQLDDALSGGSPVAAAEAFVDTLPSAGGSGTALGPADGAFDTDWEIVSGTLPIDGLAAGRHLVFVRGQDATGNWGPFSADFITVTYGLAVSSFGQVAAGRPGTTVRHSLSVVNTGALSQTLTLTYTEGVWPTALTPMVVTQMPGAVTPVTVSVAIPTDVGRDARDAITVTAASYEAPWLTYQLRLETTALWATSFLPLVLHN